MLVSYIFKFAMLCNAKCIIRQGLGAYAYYNYTSGKGNVIRLAFE